MGLDLRLKNYLVKKDVENAKKREKRNEEIKKLPVNEKISLAFEMGFPFIPPQKENKENS